MCNGCPTGDKGTKGEYGDVHTIFNLANDAQMHPEWAHATGELIWRIDDLKRTIIKLNREKCTAEERIEDKSSQRLREYEFRIQNQLGQITAYEFVIKEMFGNGESDM